VAVDVPSEATKSRMEKALAANKKGKLPEDR